MRLRTIGSPFTEDLILALEACNIKTDTDLVFSGSPTDIWLKLPQDTIRLQELIDIVQKVTERMAAPAETGLESLQTDEKRREKLASVELSSGVRSLDDLVGKFGQQQVLEISGERGSGKTALALQIVLRQLLLYPNSSVAWVDTTGDTSLDRISSVLDSLSGEVGSPTALERLQITRAFDMDTMHVFLEEIRITLSMGLLESPVLRTVVIDSITPIFRPLLSAVTSEGHATMVSFMRQLRGYADTYSITFLLLNDTSASASASKTRKPALGPSFTYESDATLWLVRWTKDSGYDVPEQNQEGIETYVAEILRSKSVQSKSWCTFTMRDGFLIQDSPRR